MIITLKFDEDEITQLWTASCKNFIKDQRARFELFKADDGYDGMTGDLFFFDEFLQLKIFQAYMQDKGFATAVWTDNDDDGWCLAVARRKERRKPKD